MIVIPRSIPFDAWPAEAAKHGLEIVRWHIESSEHALHLAAEIRSTTGQPIQFDDEIQHTLPPEPQTEPSVQPDAKSGKLPRLLNDLHRRCWSRVGETQRIDLPGGLRIDAIVAIDGATRILLARQAAYPSDSEYAMILAAWPYDPPLETAPERFEHKAWKCLRASWPTPPDQPQPTGN